MVRPKNLVSPLTLLIDRFEIGGTKELYKNYNFEFMDDEKFEKIYSEQNLKLYNEDLNFFLKSVIMIPWTSFTRNQHSSLL